MLDKLLNDFKEKMVAEDISDNTIKNYVSDIKNFYKWYREIDFSENGTVATKPDLITPQHSLEIHQQE